MSKRRQLSQKEILFLVESQNGKCANYPDKKEQNGMKGYLCPLYESERLKGSFDESGYQIDHIDEYSISKETSIENSQALCPCCHSFKTKKFMKQPTRVLQNARVLQDARVFTGSFTERFTERFTTKEIDIGRAFMVDDIEQVDKSSKKRKIKNSYS
jgi:hypothetical protein